MPGGRRNTSGRIGSTNKTQFSIAAPTNVTARSNSGERTAGSGTDDKKVEESFIGKSIAPKHVPIPVIPTDNQLMFEAVSLAVSLIAASLQLLNIYRSVWWLPYSYNSYSMNFYLIDPYLLVFILTMLSRRFIYTLLRHFIDVTSPERWLLEIHKAMRAILLVIVMSTLCWCLYHMAIRHNTMKIFYLCYPVSVYFLMFGLSIAPFFDISIPSLYVKEDRKAKVMLDKPLHNCSLSAAAIRAEVANLRSDFNRRLKRVLFASSGSAYVCGIAPMIFVPSNLYFNVPWVVQHVTLFWFGRLNAHLIQAYPVRYCDVLHRAALHLGRWIRVDSRTSFTYAQPWSDTVLWPRGSVVRYNREVYRSEGICTAAEPGNLNHYRFYSLFSNPSLLFCAVLGLQLILIGTQLFVLLHMTEWYQILSLTLLTLMNYYTLFKIARDYLVCWKVYRAEQIIQEKCQILVSTPAQ